MRQRDGTEKPSPVSIAPPFAGFEHSSCSCKTELWRSVAVMRHVRKSADNHVTTDGFVCSWALRRWVSEDDDIQTKHWRKHHSTPAPFATC